MNVFILGSNEHYFCSQNLALPQDTHSLQGSTCDLRTVYIPLMKRNVWPKQHSMQDV
jgi:hypothetical protein